ncbi:MAG: regulatory protein RecX [Rhodoglobus sp.]
MSAVDGERIAPVTYLFGATPVPESDESPEIHSPSAAEHGADSETPSGPRFVDQSEGDTGDLAESRPASRASRASEKPASSRKSQDGSGTTKGSFDRISNVSMYALARRGMSSREMRDYLLGREFETTEVDVEIDRLESVALLDDLALAETLIRTLQARKGLGRSALTAELRRRNIDQVAIESALSVLDDDDELDRAMAIAMKRAGQLRSLDAATAKRRLGDFLMRRGYSGSVVSKAVQQALAPTGPSFR